MKKIYSSFIFIVISFALMAQVPQGFKYQAVVRDDYGNILSNWDIGIRISVLKGDRYGEETYIEKQHVKSNIYGLINIVIGEGDVYKGTFRDIDWGENKHYIKMEMDLDGGSNYKEMGTTQLYAVPYALYADQAGAIKRPESVLNEAGSNGTPAGNMGGGSRATDINSKVSSSGNSWLNALVGDVGIGTDLPAYKLDVIGDVNASNYYVNGTLMENVKSINDLADGKTGTTSVFLGSGAGAADDGTDRKNVAVGDSALYNNTGGGGNTAVGHVAMYTNISGNANTAIGDSSLYSNTGVNNTALGYQSLRANTTANYNTGSGWRALQHNETGATNAAFGATALQFNTEGSYNSANGASAMAQNTTGSNNTASGYRANFHNQEGSNNTIIGYKAGYGPEVDGFHNKSGAVYLGYMAGYNDTTDNKLYISNSDADSGNALIWGDFADNVLALNGDVGIGTTTPSEKLEVVGNLRVTGKATIGPGHTNTGTNALVAGGNNNSNTQENASITGGQGNSITTIGRRSGIFTGWNNMLNGDQNVIVGGESNTINLGKGCFIGSGHDNSIETSDWTFIGGGANNSMTVQTEWSTIGGGDGNTINNFAKYSVIPGGRGNKVSGPYGFAAGRRAKANHSGTFVWADNTDADFASTGTNQFIIRANGGVGIGTANPQAKLHVAGAIKSFNAGGLQLEGGQGNNTDWTISRQDVTGASYMHFRYSNVLGEDSIDGSVMSLKHNGNMWLKGNLTVDGTLSKGGGSFRIDHPEDPANKILYHSFVESPDMMNVYNGKITTNANGYATVEMPSYFEALNSDFRYQLTAIGNFSQLCIHQEIENNRFVIRSSEPNVKVSWQVTGIRQDAWANKNRIPTEVNKTGDDKGKYLHPEAFDLPADMKMPSEGGGNDEIIE